MGKDRFKCEHCNKYGVKYTIYPRKICVDCCPKQTIGFVIEKLETAAYDHAFATYMEFKFPLEKLYDDDEREYSIFWVTASNDNTYKRCGVYENYDILLRKFVPQEDESYIEVYFAKFKGKNGFDDMKKMKQNFKRIRSGKRYFPY